MEIGSASNANESPSPHPHGNPSTDHPSEAAAMCSSSKELAADRDYIENNKAERQRALRERVRVFVRRADIARKRGCLPSPPPFEIFNYPDLLEEAWGWDRLLPFDYIDEDGDFTPQYKNYLHQYYMRNSGFSTIDRGDNDLELCLKMEGKLVSLLDQRRDMQLHIDEFRLSKMITDHVLKIDYVNCCEFPTAPIALKCITKEAQLLCELIESGYAVTSIVTTCSCIRKCVLRFMTYQGTEYVAAAATITAILKEAGLVLEFLEKHLAYDSKGVLMRTNFIRNCATTVLFKICPDTRGRNSQKLVPDEPDVKNFCDKINLQGMNEN